MSCRHFVASLAVLLIATASFGETKPEVRTKLSCDLDGDGIEESIEFFTESKDPDYPTHYLQYSITVNGSSTSYYGHYLTGDFRAVDIDSTDQYMELAVSEYGPSSDDAVHFFRFANNELSKLGTLPGMFDSPRKRLETDGSGLVTAHCRGNVLHTWFYPCKFQLNADLEFEQVCEDFYPMNANLTTRQTLPLYAKRGDADISVTLPAGTKITILGSDDSRWCLVETNDDVKGWFELSDGGRLADGRWPRDVLDGLCFAD